MDKDFNDLGKRLKMFREKNKITQPEMATACGLSRNHISSLERGCNQYSAKTLINYAIKLNMSIDELVGLSTKEYEILPELEQALGNMTQEQQQAVLTWLEVYLIHNGQIIPELLGILLKMNPEQQKKILDIIHIMDLPVDSVEN